MELFLDKNGTSLQRRKMYIGFPLHNMKSHLRFDWQNDDPSIQDQMGKKYKLNQQRQQLTQKYTEQVAKKIYSRYNELYDDNDADNEQINAKTGAPADILSQQVEQFNKSKIISQSGTNSPHLNQTPIDPYQNEKNSDVRLNQSFTYNSPRIQDHQQYDPRRDTINYRYEIPYNPENNSPHGERYRSLDIDRYNYELGSNPSKFVEKMYTGSAPNEYPFRNVIPDKLQNHLREKVKADRKREYKVNLNLFDYYTRR